MASGTTVPKVRTSDPHGSPRLLVPFSFQPTLLAMQIRPMETNLATEFRRVQIAEIEHAQLRERARTGGETECTELFVATKGSVQVGLLSLDFRPLPEPLRLYEIFVVSEYRGQGIGSFLLEQTELVGRHRGYRSIVLKPHPLDPQQRQESLVEWYGHHGYSWAASVPDLMSKVL